MPRIVAIDYGRRRIGLARSDPMGIIASGFETIEVENVESAIACIAQRISENNASEVVFGIPLGLNGEKGPMAVEAQGFSEKLQRVLKVPVTLWDERLTTRSSHRILRNAGKSPSRCKDIVDQIAAEVLLQSYLDRNQHQATDDTAELA